MVMNELFTLTPEKDLIFNLFGNQIDDQGD
jgi:hypothetical protein